MDWIFVIVRAIPLYTTFYIVSIHLMLLFISNQCSESIRASTFQYISCYSLSWEEPTTMTIKEMFQYISCYSLSYKDMIDKLLPILFQYIPCYSLSFATFYNQKTCNRFNTSHVTLYPDHQTLHYRLLRCFNTSHVTLYQQIAICDKCGKESFNTSHVTLYLKRSN